jgi:hypothetical protein
MQGVWRTARRTARAAAVLVDEHRLARRDVAHDLEAEHVERDALGGEHVLECPSACAPAEHQRADAVRVAEAEHAVADHHRDDGIAPRQRR